MPRPFRMANTRVRIRLQQQGARQPLDSTFGAKVAMLDEQHGEVIEVLAQMRYARHRALDPMTAGDSEMTRGHMAIGWAELRRRGLDDPVERLKHSRVISVQRQGTWQDEDLQVVEVVPRGHLSGVGPNHVLARFEKHRDAVGSRRR